jgi:hypothetical protein
VHVILVIVVTAQIFIVVDSTTNFVAAEERVWYNLFLGDDDVSALI